MDKMYEYLKTVKRSHSYLLFSCVIFIGIGLSIQDSSNINKAINEVTGYNTFSSSRFFYNPSLLDKILLDSDKELIKTYTPKFREIRKQYKNLGYGINASLFDPGVNPSYESINSEYKSLDEILTNIESLQKEDIFLLYPNIIDFDNKMNTFLEELNQGYPKYIDFQSTDYDIKNQNFIIRTLVYYKFDKKMGTKEEERDKVIKVDFNSKNLNNSWLDLLYKNGLVNEFVSKNSDEDYNIFEFSKLYWRSIKDVNPSNAIVRLKEIRATIPTQHSMTLFGFSIDLGPMKFIGPVIITLLFLNFYLHLSYLNKRKPNQEIIEYFPWISIYTDRISITVSWIIIFILPSLSVITIFLGFMAEDVWYNFISLGISLLAMAFVIWMAVLSNKVFTSIRKFQN